MRISPDYPEARNALVSAHYNLGVTLSKSNRLPEAVAQFDAALRIKPDYAEAHNNLGVVLSRMGSHLPEAIEHFESAVRISPDYADAHYNLGVALSKSQIECLRPSVSLKPHRELDRMRRCNKC